MVGGSSMTESESYVNSGKEMSIWAHLSELRSRLITCLVSTIVMFVVSISWATHIIKFLSKPLQQITQIDSKLHFTGPLDVLIANIKVSFFAALIFTSPIWIYNFWKFIEPALYHKEKKLIQPFTLASLLLFFTGLSFCYFLILPIALEFLISLGIEVGTPIITINDYLSLVTVMVFGFGIVFETPLILILLSYLNILTYKTLVSSRKYVIVFVFIIGALLTPPDPLSQVAMAVPLYLMYELSLIIIKFMQKNKI
jgi:sec-independent protein translocase protein TatC